MPYLDKIVVQDFRNIELQELSFCPNVNCISGGNGEGKTNLLDAIWYLSMTKSAFAASDQFAFRYGAKAFAISGLYHMENGVESRFSIQVSKEGDAPEKKLRRDDKPCKRISDHIGLLPIVMVSPADVSMVSESGDERRRFVNAVLSQMDKEYLSNIQQYNRILAQRNKMIKSGITDEDLLLTFDEGLNRYAVPVHEARKAFIKELEPVVQDFYSTISGGRESVGIDYRSCMLKGDLIEILKEHREQDAFFKYTTAGIQRDDFIFTMDGHAIRRCGSQGQQKSFLVALKFAQYEVMKRSYGFPPILLLDDLFDKLDMGRVSNLLQMVAGSEFGQIFLTDSNKVRISKIVDSLTSDRTYFEASGGTFKRIDE